MTTIKIKSFGFKCGICGYMPTSFGNIFNHLRERHNWISNLDFDFVEEKD